METKNNVKLNKESPAHSILEKMIKTESQLDFSYGSIKLVSLRGQFLYDADIYKDHNNVPEECKQYFTEDEFYWLVLDEEFDPEGHGSDWHHPNEFNSIQLTYSEYTYLLYEFNGIDDWVWEW